MKTELFEALQAWSLVGDRSVDIGLRKDSTQIWCYDFSIMNGTFVTSIDEIPTEKELVGIKLKDLESEIEQLKGNLPKEK